MIRVNLIFSFFRDPSLYFSFLNGPKIVTFFAELDRNKLSKKNISSYPPPFALQNSLTDQIGISILVIPYHMCVCLSVCLSVHFLRYRLIVFLPPLPEVRCPIFLEIRTSWGKVIERSGQRFEHFSLKVV